MPGTDKPWARFCWGQDPAHRRFFAEKDMMAHIHHADRERVDAEPIMETKTIVNQDTGLITTNRVVVGFSRWFKKNQVAPAGLILKEMTLRTDIGIPRFFFEVADVHEEAEWERLRFTAPNGQTHLITDPETGQKRPIDCLGPYPPGGVTYRTVMSLSQHTGQCNCKYQADKIHAGLCCCDFETRNEICPGEFRTPQWHDINGAKAMWHEFVTRRTNSFGLRDSAPDQLLQWATQASWNEQAEKERKQFEELKDAWKQELPSGHFLTSHGHGADVYKYHFQGLPLTPRDNQHRKEKET